MRRLVILFGALAVAVLVTAAGCAGSGTVPISPPAQLAYTCGTTAIPPIAASPGKCTAARGSTRVTGGHRWYSAPADDVDEPKERPKIGKPLHGDWWNPVERADD